MILDLGVLGLFDTKIKARNIVQIHKGFELYQIFMYNILNIYIIQKKN